MNPPARRGPQGDVIADLALVLIDGDNLLHRVRGSRDDAGLHWLLPRLRAWRPMDVHIVVMLDGHPDTGIGPRTRVAPGIESQHSGSVDADTAIVGIVRARPYAERSRTLVISDDRQLGDRVRHVGGFVRRLDWLTSQLLRADGPAAPAPQTRAGATGPDGPRRTPLGAGRPPRRIVRGPAPGREPGSDAGDEPEREPWKPGRGATRKRGNPKRGAGGQPHGAGGQPHGAGGQPHGRA